ncbi:MAG: transketolase C-terminal domain-containing protein [Lachnospiraceae bacterium]|nr:transketolase C-terminal domain-containing protein [Lachnospiraceae bacterium]
MTGETFNFGDMFESSRSIVGQTLIDIGKTNKNAVVLTADLSRTNQTLGFKENYPERFFNVGIAEQNMLGIAAGLALEGKIPFVLTFATFASMRACEQLRTDICYQNLKVRIIACNAGLTTGGGATHYGQEDIGIARTFANLTVVTPGDPNKFRDVLMSTMDIEGPVYIRMGQGKGEPVVYKEEQMYEIGKAVTCHEGNDITVVACGVMLSHAVEAAKILEKDGIHVRVLDMHTIKPIDQGAILEALKDTGKIITAEDHYIIGGLGSAVAEVIAESGKTCQFKRLGIPGEYAGFGTANELYAKYGYDCQGIVNAVHIMLKGEM